MDSIFNLITLVISAFVVGAGMAWTVAWAISKLRQKPNDSGSRRTAVVEKAEIDFERETRLILAQILDRLTRIEMSFNGHPNWDQVRALVKEEIVEHEYHEHGKDRRKVT